MRRLFVGAFILALACGVSATQNTFIGGKWSAGSILSTDTVSATGTAIDTIDGNQTFMAYRRPAANLQIQRKTAASKFTYSTFWNDSGTTGAKAYPDSIVQTGNGHFWISSGSGTITSASTNLIFNGIDTLNDNKGQTFMSCAVGNSASLSVLNVSQPTIIGGGPLLTMGTNAVLNLPLGSIVWKMSATGTIFSFASGATINNSGTVFTRASSEGITITVPACVNTFIGGAVTFGTFSYTATFKFAGDFKTTGAVYFTDATGNNPKDSLYACNLKCTVLRVGNQSGSGVVQSVWGTGLDTITSYDHTTYNLGASRAWFQTSQWWCSGNWTNDINDTIKDNGPTLTLTGASTIKTVGQRFNNLTFAGGANNKDSTADSLYVVNDFTVTSGRAKQGGHSWRVGHNAVFGGADSLYQRMTGSRLYMDGGTWQVTNTLPQAGRMTDSLRIFCNGGLIHLMDSNNQINRESHSSDKKYSYQAGKTLKFFNNVAGDFSGTSGHPDTLQSTSAGNAATLYFGIQPNESYVAVKDLKAQNYALVDTVGGTNLGNDSNVIFRDAIGQYYNTPAVPTLASASPATGKLNTKDTLAGTKLFAPCSASVDGGGWLVVNVIDSTKAWLPMPDHANGAVNIIVKNADMRLDTLVGGFTYQNAPSYTLTMASAHGTPTPSAGAHTVDSGMATVISEAPNAGYRFSTWQATAGVTFGSAATTNSNTAALSQNATVTALDTTLKFVLTTAKVGTGTVTPSTGSVDSGASTAIVATPGAHWAWLRWTRSSVNVVVGDTTLATTTAVLKAAGTVTANFIGADSIYKCYPQAARVDTGASVAKRLFTAFFKKTLPEALTANTVLHLGSVSLGKAASNTDSSVTDTLSKYPTLTSGYPIIWASDAAWLNATSCTTSNTIRLLRPTLTPTGSNP